MNKRIKKKLAKRGWLKTHRLYYLCNMFNEDVGDFIGLVNPYHTQYIDAIGPNTESMKFGNRGKL